MNKADCICELKQIRGVYARMRKEYGSCVEALDMAINALEQTAWIPCEERMPGHEYIDKCILISMAGETIVARVLDGINYGRGVWEFDNYSEAMGREAEFYPWNKIDAWMPLPAPYKEDTE